MGMESTPTSVPTEMPTTASTGSPSAIVAAAGGGDAGGGDGGGSLGGGDLLAVVLVVVLVLFMISALVGYVVGYRRGHHASKKTHMQQPPVGIATFNPTFERCGHAAPVYDAVGLGVDNSGHEACESSALDSVKCEADDNTLASKVAYHSDTSTYEDPVLALNPNRKLGDTPTFGPDDQQPGEADVVLLDESAYVASSTQSTDKSANINDMIVDRQNTFKLKKPLRPMHSLSVDDSVNETDL
jgi:hypothetical protein